MKFENIRVTYSENEDSCLYNVLIRQKTTSATNWYTTRSISGGSLSNFERQYKEYFHSDVPYIFGYAAILFLRNCK